MTERTVELYFASTFNININLTLTFNNFKYQDSKPMYFKNTVYIMNLNIIIFRHDMYGMKLIELKKLQGFRRQIRGFLLRKFALMLP